MINVKQTEKIIIAACMKGAKGAFDFFSHVQPDTQISDDEHRAIVAAMKKHFHRYGDVPNETSIKAFLTTEKQADVLKNIIAEYDPNIEGDAFLDLAEEMCKINGTFSAISQAVEVYKTSKDDNRALQGLVPLFEKATQISFSRDEVFEYMKDEDLASTLSSYARRDGLPFTKSKLWTRLFNGNLPRGTLNIVAAPPNTGKSLVLCDVAAIAALSGINVAYFSMEMSESEISKRIDANLLSINIDNFTNGIITASEYSDRVAAFKRKNKNLGKIFIKQFPTGDACAMDFKACLKSWQETLTHENDSSKIGLVVSDYAGIMRPNVSDSYQNSYNTLGRIAIELRGLAIEFNIPVFTAAQLRRDYSVPPVQGDLADSMQLAHHSDFIVAPYLSPEFENPDDVGMAILKTRYGSKLSAAGIVTTIDYEHMRLRDIRDDVVSGNGRSYNDSLFNKKGDWSL